MSTAKYYVPVIGYIVAAVEWQLAYNAWKRQNDSATRRELLRRYGNTVTAFMVTVISLAIASVSVPLLQWMNVFE